MSRFKRGQAKYVQQTHSITNWPAYDRALVNRGSLTFWFTDEAIGKWTAAPSGKAGGQLKYSRLHDVLGNAGESSSWVSSGRAQGARRPEAAPRTNAPRG